MAFCREGSSYDPQVMRNALHFRMHFFFWTCGCVGIRSCRTASGVSLIGHVKVAHLGNELVDKCWYVGDREVN